MSIGSSIKLRIAKLWRSILTLKGSPRDIALGTAIGVVVAFTPTIGFQMFIGAVIATCFRASRPAAMIPAWITNPVTIPPIYTFTYWLGSLFWSGPSAGEVYNRLLAVVKALGSFSWYSFYGQFVAFLKIGWDVFVAMTIGGLIVGAILAAAAYPLTFRAVVAYRAGRQHHRLKMDARRAARRAARGEAPPPA